MVTIYRLKLSVTMLCSFSDSNETTIGQVKHNELIFRFFNKASLYIYIAVRLQFITFFSIYKCVFQYFLNFLNDFVIFIKF